MRSKLTRVLPFRASSAIGALSHLSTLPENDPQYLVSTLKTRLRHIKSVNIGTARLNAAQVAVPLRSSLLKIRKPIVRYSLLPSNQKYPSHVTRPPNLTLHQSSIIRVLFRHDAALSLDEPDHPRQLILIALTRHK